MRLWYRFCRALAWIGFRLYFGGRVFGVEKVPRKGAVLLVCNHQSFLDPVLATVALPRECHYMARDTLFKGGRFQKLIESLNAFPVKRGSADVGAIKETLKRLKQGALITIFPEATRTEDGSVRPMQPGVVLIARKAGVPLIPTLILGAFEAWPKSAKKPRPARILVSYGEPLTPERAKTMSDEECINHLRNEIIAMMHRYREHPSMRGRLKPLPPPVAGATSDAGEAEASRPSPVRSAE
ncbi:MAG: hypothetical protein AMXMBFR47_30680 [Planctomycetota bacterium]